MASRVWPRRVEGEVEGRHEGWEDMKGGWVGRHEGWGVGGKT